MLRLSGVNFFSVVPWPFRRCVSESVVAWPFPQLILSLVDVNQHKLWLYDGELCFLRLDNAKLAFDRIRSFFSFCEDLEIR